MTKNKDTEIKLMKQRGLEMIKKWTEKLVEETENKEKESNTKGEASKDERK